MAERMEPMGPWSEASRALFWTSWYIVMAMAARTAMMVTTIISSTSVTPALAPRGVRRRALPLRVAFMSHFPLCRLRCGSPAPGGAGEHGVRLLAARRVVHGEGRD